jgi:glycosyltransferase involved in cell wall biosynthesis
MKIKVLQVIHALHIGGAEKVVINIASQIDRSRFDMEICCVNDIGSLAQELIDQGIRVFCPRSSRDSWFTRLVKLRRTIRQSRPHIVHTHGTPALLEVGTAYLAGGMPPWVHTFHFGNYPHLKRRYLLGERFLSKFASRLVAVSEHQRDAVMRHLRVNPSKIQTIVNGVGDNPYLDDSRHREARRAELGLAPTDVVVGCVAVLSHQKGISYLLEGAKRVAAGHPEVRFVIVGGGPLLENLKEKAEDLGLRGVVTFTGWRNDALALLPAFDMFILPSLWEGFSVVVLEAMAARRAVIVTDVGDNSRFIQSGHNGLIIPVMDPVAIEESVVRLATNLELRMKMGGHAYALFRSQYTTGAMVRRYEQLYEEMGAARIASAARAI